MFHTLRKAQPVYELDTSELRSALWLLTHVHVMQYLLANTRARGNGAHKAHHHGEITRIYVGVLRCSEPDNLQRSKNGWDDFTRLHDISAAKLTNRLDEVIGFDLDGYVDDEICQKFFMEFRKIAMNVLVLGEMPSLRPTETK